MRHREALLEVGHEPVGRARRRVAAVEQGVDDDVVGAFLPRELGDGDGVAVDRVDAAGADQADQVQATARLGRAPDGLEQRRVA